MSAESSNASISSAFKEKLKKHEETIQKSDVFSHTVAVLQPLNFTHIRCLALGSPSQEFQALYQLAYLNLLVSEFDISADHVSLYDPAFVAADESLLTSELQYLIEAPQQYTPSTEMIRNTLFYMPHAPRSLTEEILVQLKPCWFLANDFSVTMGTLTKARFLAEYPKLATLVHVYEQKTDKLSSNSKPKSDDGFAPVVSRRKRNRPRKNVYVEPELIYDQDTYFSDVTIERLRSESDAAWKDSFSDLALNVVVPKPIDSADGK